MKKWQWIWAISHAFGVAGIVTSISIIVTRPESIDPFATATGLLITSIALWVWGWKVWSKNG